MIKKLYETHLQVKDLKTAINFYQDKLGLELGYATEKKRLFLDWRTRLPNARFMAGASFK